MTGLATINRSIEGVGWEHRFVYLVPLIDRAGRFWTPALVGVLALPARLVGLCRTRSRIYH